MSLKAVLEKIDKIASTTKRLKKEEYIEEYKDDELFVRVVRLAEDPMSPRTLKKRVEELIASLTYTGF